MCIRDRCLDSSFLLYRSGIVYKAEQLKVKMSQRLDLRAYPFDEHHLVFTYMSTHYDNNNVTIRLLSDDTGDASWMIDPWIEGWSITDTQHEIGYKRMHDATGVFRDYDVIAVSYTHLRAHETPEHLVCRLLLEKKKQTL
eukprot:TRINITY_DN30576_c0_g1_i1.p1 TRINITY_DN30576_c0_g1~~TRINITY_DN30576_c0_g1_i1.p1  ORF type:complete len:140 (+),score=45.30 TRINITY_DN30576_c0_g1_i1:155-574(+)